MRKGKHADALFPGADRGRRGGSIPASLGDATTDLRLVLETLRSRSRALATGNPYGLRALELLRNHLVGTGFRGSVITADERRQNRLRKLWRRWHSKPSECDYHGRLNFNALQAQVASTLVESGEVLIRRYYAPDNETVPLQIQVLEPDFVDSNRETFYDRDGATELMGIRFRQGRPLGYWLYDQHPGSSQAVATSSFHDAADILHVFRVDRAGQIRGLPWCTPLLLRLSDFDDAVDNELVRQKLAGCYLAFITDVNGAPPPDSPEYEAELEPGTIELLPPGKDVKLSSPPQVPNWESFTTVMLRQIASGYSLTYEGLTGDYSRVNYSSARMALQDFNNTIDCWQQRTIVPQFLDRIWDWWIEAAENTGPVEMNWVPPRHVLIDPEKEVRALVLMIRAGLISYDDAVRALGGDPDVMTAQIAATNERLDELGLILDSDGRNPVAGSPHQAETRDQDIDDRPEERRREREPQRRPQQEDDDS